MRLAAGLSTFAISIPVVARTGSSHFRLLGRMAARGAFASPRPSVEALAHVSRANPRMLHPVCCELSADDLEAVTATVEFGGCSWPETHVGMNRRPARTYALIIS